MGELQADRLVIYQVHTLHGDVLVTQKGICVDNDRLLIDI